MTVDERLAQAKKKAEQAEHRQILRDNRENNAKEKELVRRKFFVGEMFTKHFPIVLEIAPNGLSKESLEPLDNFMEALAECQRRYQDLEDSVLRSP